jgi:heterodisulfide reductase subunit A
MKVNNMAALVIGGGIAGIQAAIDLANQGIKVYLIEKTPSIGGHMAQLDKTFPTLDCSACILTPRMVEVARHPNIKLIANAELFSVMKQEEQFYVKIVKKATYVDPKKCTGCGACSKKCPVSVDSEFEVGLGKRSAIFTPFPQAVPSSRVIDKENCLYFKENTCRTCEKICFAKAINFTMSDQYLDLKVNSIIIATGFTEFDPTIKKEFGFGKYKNLITALQLERLLSASGPTKGHLIRLSDNSLPKRIAFVQCVGARDEKLGLNYCSGVCCMYAIKNAILIKDHYPNTEVDIFYIDMRTYGKGFEEFYTTAKEQFKIRFIRGRVAEIYEDPLSKNLIIKAENTETRELLEKEFDLVVLSIALGPNKDNQKIAKLLGLELDEHQFFKTSSVTPCETNVHGVFVAGTAAGPMDIPDAVAHAGCSALSASLFQGD